MHRGVPNLKAWALSSLLIAGLVYCGIALSWAHAAVPLPAADANFLIHPYLQLGEQQEPVGKPQTLTICWAALTAGGGDWSVNYKSAGSPKWQDTSDVHRRTAELAGLPVFTLYDCTISNLAPGKHFDYQVLKNKQVVFSGKSSAPKDWLDPYTFLVVGDIASGSSGQREIGYRLGLEKPDFIVVPGDIVYSAGRVLEYLELFFPVYNAKITSILTGSQILRSTLLLAAPGNHDTAWGNADASALNEFSDGLAYYYFWKQPLNGPTGRPIPGQSTIPKGSQSRIAAFRKAAGKNYPRMNNFSFDYGNSHWTALDSNPYMDWTRKDLRNWLIDDLQKAKNATWKFVVFHHPPFTTHGAHFNDQQMRVICDILEEQGVDVVFAGHVHNYQRTYPLTFKPTQDFRQRLFRLNGTVFGDLRLDKTFDGVRNKTPKGVIYVITGGGGARLYDSDETGRPSRWTEYTAKVQSSTHSYSRCKINGPVFELTQFSQEGGILDRFTIDKSKSIIPAPQPKTAVPATR